MKDPTSMDKDLQPGQFEEQLRRSLTRVEAPAGFCDRVLERAAAAENCLPQPRRLLLGRRWGWIGAAAVLLLVVLAANQIRVWRERARVAEIQAQFDTAMRVTTGALAQTRAELRRRGLSFGE